MHVRPAVTCHLNFLQNDCDLLHATASTLGWNKYQNNSQHRKSTPEEKILPPLKPITFQSWDWHLTTELPQLPMGKTNNTPSCLLYICISQIAVGMKPELSILHNHIYIYIYDLVPKGAHARGYALQLKIKRWKLFLFKMLCCVLAWMNEYIVQIISATRL